MKQLATIIRNSAIATAMCAMVVPAFAQESTEPTDSTSKEAYGDTLKLKKFYQSHLQLKSI